MSTTRLLPGPESSLEHDFDELLRQRSRLEEDLEHAKAALQEARAQMAGLARGRAKLRRSLAPLYDALREIFEELGTDDSSSESPMQSNSFWETQKRRFPGKPSEIIDLLIERPMNTTQLATAGRMDPRTVTKTIYILNKAGLVVKNGGMFSLKEL